MPLMLLWIKESFNKDVKINAKDKIYDKKDENKIIDVIISTIQSGQSLTENVFQIFVQILINTPIHEINQR